jgi:hypothetical protein
LRSVSWLVRVRMTLLGWSGSGLSGPGGGVARC